ncbi:uncharacterized protein L3040_003563 [Drepanopeziza brunnea f. sp. 'multigermtubi']|uniref:uncharacterized protein n=1 Tax=Drepanopeziza brunnea f. sp. 'multigermtubi' TaxID=698441 RepID=UPI00238ACECF|nr:hypothetical protein L3040_003563 [Drepanopeziza brunnea f. sp. 'multigermtubi']
MIPQLQVLMSQKDVVELSRELINVLTVKVRNFTAPMRHVYIKYFKGVKAALELIISHLSNMMSAQTTSKRTQ